MNPLTNVRNIQKLNQTELQLGTVGKKKSWHDQYKDSAWIFIGGLPYDLTEGDILCVFSQYGEIVNMNLVRDKLSGKSKGFGFICYEDQRSTVLAVDNLNSIKLLGRVIRVDHVEKYKVPKEHDDEDEMTKQLREEGCAPKIESLEEEEEDYDVPVKKVKKEKDPDKKSKKKKKEKKKKKKAESDSESDQSLDHEQPIKIKKEKYDPGYEQSHNRMNQERFGQRDRDSNGPVDRQRERFVQRDRDSNRPVDRQRERFGNHDRNQERTFGRDRNPERFDDSHPGDRERIGDDRERQQDRFGYDQDRSRERFGDSDRNSRNRDSDPRGGARQQEGNSERWRDSREGRRERDGYSRGDNYDERPRRDYDRSDNRDDFRDRNDRRR